MFRFILIAMVFILPACQDDDNLFGPPDDVESDIYDHINHYRLQNGREVLERHDTLDVLASGHAMTMAGNNELSHENQGDRYQTVVAELNMNQYAELVASGNLNGKDLIDQWSDDDASKRTILGDYIYIGVGVYDNDDLLFATVIFTK